MSDKNDPHIAGRYAIIVALIGLVGTFGAVFLSNSLAKNEEKEKLEISNEKTENKPISERDADEEMNMGTFTDSRDGQTYKWVRLKDGKKWMVQNLNFEMDDSSCYGNKPKNCTEYGRLYTWYAAVNACPNGWRLPTDDEWWKMTGYYGKSYNEDEGQPNNEKEDAGKAAYLALMQGGSSGFSALLGGSPNGTFYELGKYGFYWSSTENRSFNAWEYTFSYNGKYLGRYYANKSFGRSCRCFQD